MKKLVRFKTGRVLVTPGVRDKVNPLDVLTALMRHGACDWGDLDDEDIKANEWALENGARLLSAYHEKEGKKRKFWVITEADRSVTTVLLPEEY